MARSEKCDGYGLVVAVAERMAPVSLPLLGSTVSGDLSAGSAAAADELGELKLGLELELELELEAELGRDPGCGLRSRGTRAASSRSWVRRTESTQAANGLRLARFWVRMWRCGLLKWLAAFPNV